MKNYYNYTNDNNDLISFCSEVNEMNFHISNILCLLSSHNKKKCLQGGHIVSNNQAIFICI